MIPVQFHRQCILQGDKLEMHTRVESFEHGNNIYALYHDLWTWTLKNV